MFRILELFERPIPAQRIKMRQVRARWSEGTRALVREKWRRHVLRYCARLGPEYRLALDENGWPAAYRGTRCVLWAGRVYSLQSYSIGRTLSLSLAPLNFAWITAGLTFAIASDERVLFTVRGPASNVFAGMLHGNGGNPDRIEPVAEHQIRETMEEVLARRSEIVPGSMVFGGMTESLSARFRGKPMLVGWLRLSVPSRTILRRVHRRPWDDRPTDAVDVQAVPLSAPAMRALARRRIHPLCPAGRAGLEVLGRHFFGPPLQPSRKSP
jgi:hypothetical protein